MVLTPEDIEILEAWWIKKSRVNFLAFRKYIRVDDFETNWFIEDLCRHLHKFYQDLRDGKRPVLIIQSPPQHGKSWAVTDFISWILGKLSYLRVIYASYSDTLGKRCNLAQQRVMSTPKYKAIFPETNLPRKGGMGTRTTEQIEFFDSNYFPTKGQFRNTTVAGPITGESLDLGIIDDAVKGREQANSKTWSDKIWNWFTDDFMTRFSKTSGLLVIMTRWTNHDLIGRLKKKYRAMNKKLKIVNYPAIANKDGKYRKEGEPLFPELKPLDFLLEKKATMLDESWSALYQGKPIVAGGNLIKSNWWKWWERLPKLKFTFAVADTAQKKNNWNDWTVMEHWGFGVDNNIYLLNMHRERVKAPDLRRKGEAFYLQCEKEASEQNCFFRGMCIEDKSSGIGLIQEFEEKQLKVHSIPRSTDKITRAYDTGPEIKTGKVHLNQAVPGVLNITTEALEFPNGEYDDAFDCTMNAVEVAYLYPEILNSEVFVA